MENRLKRVEEKLDTFIQVVQFAFEKIDKKFESFDKRFDVIDERFDVIDERFDVIDKRFVAIDKQFDTINFKLNTLTEKVDVLQGNSSQTIETLETGLNDIKTEIVRIAVVTRYEMDYPYLFKEKKN